VAVELNGRGETRVPAAPDRARRAANRAALELPLRMGDARAALDASGNIVVLPK
jgi:hypothetical protein